MILPPLAIAQVGTILAVQKIAAEIKPYAPADFRTGGETFFDGATIQAVGEYPAWKFIWDRHIRNETLGNTAGIASLNPPPDVNFRENFVMAMFTGPTRNVVGYQVASGFQLGNKATVRIAPVYGTQGALSVAVPRPWLFLVLPRTEATVEVQLIEGGKTRPIYTIPPSR